MLFLFTIKGNEKRSPKMNNKFINLLFLATIIVFVKKGFYIKTQEVATTAPTTGGTGTASAPAAETPAAEKPAAEDTINPPASDSGSGEGSPLGSLFSGSTDEAGEDEDVAGASDDSKNTFWDNYGNWIIIGGIALVALIVLGVVMGVLKKKE